MAKKPTPAPMSKEPPINEALIREDMDAANTLAVVQVQQNERVTALARQLNYSGSTDPSVLENSARDVIRRVGAAIFELGAYLILMKEACPHGAFLPALERLGLGVDAAGRYMQVTRRFANSATSRNLEGVGVWKLVELLPLDNEQIADMTELGQTGELALDDVARMSVKELRAAVHKERAIKERLSAVNSELNSELALKKNLKIAATDWPERFKGLMDQAALAERTLMNQIGALEAIRATATEDQPQSPEEEEPLNRARAVLADQMSAAYQRITEYLEKSGLLFDRTLGAYAEGVRK